MEKNFKSQIEKLKNEKKELERKNNEKDLINKKLLENYSNLEFIIETKNNKIQELKNHY